MPCDVCLDLSRKVIKGREGASSKDSAPKDREPAFDLIEPRRVLGCEMLRPVWVLVEPLLNVGSVVSREVVHDEVASARGVEGRDCVEEVDECVRVVALGGEPEGTSAAHVERAHPGEGAVPDILELAAYWLTGLHRDVRILAFESLDAGFLVHADDVLLRRCLIVDAKDVIAFFPELVVLRCQVHLLSMRLQVSVREDASDAAVADIDSFGANVLTQKTYRPVRNRQPYIAWLAARFSLYSGSVRVRERERGRPERGASARAFTGSSAATNRFFQSQAVREFTPRMRATSFGPTPSAISRRAWPRKAIRFSVFAGRMAFSTSKRCAPVSGSASARGPLCGRVTHGVGSITRSALHRGETSGQICAVRH